MIINLVRKINKDMHLRELFRGSSIAFVFRILSALSSYIFIYFLAHTYGAIGVGIFSTSWTILMIGAVFAKMGFDSSIVRFLAESCSFRGYLRMRNIYKKSLFITIISSFIVFIIIAALSPHLTRWFYETMNSSWVLILIGAGIIFYSLMSFNAESLKGLKKIFAFSIHQNITVYLGSLAVLSIISYFFSDNRLIITALVGTIFLLMISSFLTIKHIFRYYPKKDSFYSPPSPKTKQIMSITVPMMFTNSLFLLLNWTDVLMLAALTDDASVGIYNTALKVAALNSLVLIALNSIAMPKYAELYQNNKEKFKKLVKTVSFISFILALPVFLIILCFPDFIMGLFDFSKGHYALIILSAGQLFAAVSGSTIHLLNMTGREKITMYILIISVSINFILNYSLIPVLGINGAAWATAISTVLWNVLAVIMIYKYNGFLTYPLINPREIKNFIFILKDKNKP